MAAWPKLDKSRPFSKVTPPYMGAVAEQDGLHFDVAGRVVEALLSDEQRKRFSKPMPKPAGEAPAKKSSTEALHGSSVLPAEIPLNDETTIALGDLVAEAHARSGLTAADWNALEEADREGRLSRLVAELRAKLNPVEPDEEEAEAEAAAPTPPKGPPAGPPEATEDDKPDDGEKTFKVENSGKPKVKADPSKVDLGAWLRGTADYPFMTVVAAAKKQYAVAGGSKKALIDALVDKGVVKPGEVKV